MTGPAGGDLGPCEVGWCDRPAVAYVSRTVGRSPRLLVVAGERAAQLAAASTGRGATFGAMRCVDCAVGALEDTVGHMPAGVAW